MIWRESRIGCAEVVYTTLPILVEITDASLQTTWAMGGRLKQALVTFVHEKAPVKPGLSLSVVEKGQYLATTAIGPKR
jgi:hypothetical protein